MLNRVCALFICFWFVGLARAQSSCHLRELDLCAAGVLGYAQRGYPTTDNDLNKMCGAIREAQNCIKSFTQRCSTSQQRGFIDLFLQGGLGGLSEFCKQGSQIRKTYLTHASCLNRAQRNQRPCLKDFQTGVEVFTQMTWDKQLKTGCCAIRRLRDCNDKVIRQVCGDEAVNSLEEMTSSLMPKVAKLVCSEMDPAGKLCTSLLPASGTTFTGEKSKSIIARLLTTYGAV